MNNYCIPNLAKACRVLSWLASEPGAHTASAVARQLEMPRTTAFRVLRTLCSEGLVDEVDGKYRSGAGLLRLGLLALQTVEIHALAEPILAALAQETGETSHLAVRSGEQMLILHVEDSPHPIRVASRPGTLVTIHCAATGKALLATLPIERVRAMFDGRSFEKRTERSVGSLAELEAELDAVRRQGFAIDDEEYHPGVRCLAAAVFDARGDAVGAIGVTATTQRFAKRRIRTMSRSVIDAANALSEAMGRQRPGSVA